MWSEWSSPINIEYVIEEPPLVAIINEELYAGQPFSILIGEKLNATGYGVGVYDTNSRYSEQIYYNYYEHAGTFTLDDIAPYLHAGHYRLVVSAYVNQIEVKKNIDFMVLDQERPSKPLVRLQMPTEATPTDLQSTEEITTTSLNVPANKTYVITTWTDDGVEELYIKHKRNNEEWFVSGKTHVITNSKINRIDEKWDQGYINDVFTYQVAAKCNGVWSEWSDVLQVKIIERSEEWTSDDGITIVCPWGLAGGADSTIRPMASLLQDKLGIPVEIRNEVGGNGVVGTVVAHNMPADGHTFLLGTQTLYIQDLLDLMDFNFMDEFECEDILIHSINILAGSKINMQKYGISNYTDLRNYAVEHPYEVSIAMMTTYDVNGMCFEAATDGLPLNPVTYDYGSAANSDMAGGYVDLSVGGYDEMSGLIESGDIIPLLVFCEHRVDNLPDCECTGELGIDCYAGTWRAIFAKKGTPQNAIDKLVSAIEDCRSEPSWQQFIRNEAYNQRSVPASGTATESFCKKEYKAIRDYLYQQEVLRKDYDILK